MATEQTNRTCEHCGNNFAFHPKSPRQRFCSLRCAKQHRPIYTEATRFWLKVNRDGSTPTYRPDLGPCWIWVAAVNGNGYGQFMRESQRQTSAHIWAYETLVGPVSTTLQLDHLCRVRRCVNPSHLEAVPASVNLLRGYGCAAQNARKTMCKHGHVFDDANTMLIPKGRSCRRCKQLSQQRQQPQRREAQRRRRLAARMPPP
jgi:hypothetical protein